MFQFLLPQAKNPFDDKKKEEPSAADQGGAGVGSRLAGPAQGDEKMLGSAAEKLNDATDGYQKIPGAPREKTDTIPTVIN